jgi:hypothetical protein
VVVGAPVVGSKFENWVIPKFPIMVDTSIAAGSKFEKKRNRMEFLNLSTNATCYK